MLTLWRDLFFHRISPEALLVELAGGLHWFNHGDVLLLFGKDRATRRLSDPAGERADRSSHPCSLPRAGSGRPVPAVPDAAGPPGGLRRGITLSAQSTGYASFLFRRYERLFHELGFHLIRLNAGLSVGKYYWAKEGFDCSDRGQFQKMQDGLWALVRRLSLPVAEQEVRRLTHMSDVAAFRRDLKVPVWRDAEGYYTLEHDIAHPEEFLFPLGKAFLFCANPWDGHKVI